MWQNFHQVLVQIQISVQKLAVVAVLLENASCSRANFALQGSFEQKLNLLYGETVTYSPLRFIFKHCAMAVTGLISRQDFHVRTNDPNKSLCVSNVRSDYIAPSGRQKP